MNEKIQLLQASVEFIKEKLKAIDFGKSHLENRLTNIESRVSIIVNGSSKVQKENITNLDVQLSNSHLFASSLKKVDANVTSNLRKLQDHFGTLLQESQSKFCEIQEKIIGMLTQKEKILRNLTFQVENHAHSIAGIEQWIKGDHQQTNSIHLVQENVRQKVQLMQRNADMKVQILQEKIKFLEQFQESILSNFKNLSSKYEDFDEKNRVFKKESKKQFTEIQDKIEEKIEKFCSEVNEKMQKYDSKAQFKKQSKLSGEGEEIFLQTKRKLNNYATKLEDYDEKLTRVSNKVSYLQEKVQSTAKDVQKLQQSQNKTKKISSDKGERVFSSVQQRNNFQQMNYTSKKAKQPKEIDKFLKKELPPRKNLFQQHLSSQNYEEQQVPQMRGGIRGLLQKSKDKDKQRQGLLKTNDPLGRKQQTSSRKGLPPVKEDPSAKKKGNQRKNYQQQTEEQEAMVYQIDEEGYLMDDHGNYLLDETGAMIRLSAEQIQEYMMEEQY